jgi:hypothetical protein
LILRQGFACSISKASSSKVRSSPWAAQSWMAIGRPSSELPKGSEIAGAPAALASGVKPA